MITNRQFKTSCSVLTVYCIFACAFHNVMSSEISESTWTFDNSLGIKVSLPVLVCRTKYNEYREVRWYKDYTLFRRSSPGVQAGPADHIMVLADLIKDFTKPPHLDNPLKLQGYYWCETDYVNESLVLRYLFKIPEIHTFVGKVLSHRDSLGKKAELSKWEKIEMAKFIYESDLQEMLFGFLPSPNTYVTDVLETPTGLEVHFYLYVRQLFDPRQRFANDLIEDQHELQYVFEYLNNQTTTIDEKHYADMLDWVKFKGIRLEEVELLSTLGCYQASTLESENPPKDLTWPYAKLGEVVIPYESCSAKSGLPITRLCTGSFYNGARWGNPSGKCSLPPSKITIELRNLYDRLGDKPGPQFMKKLQDLTNRPEQLVVTDLHIVTDILTEVSEGHELKEEELHQIISVIDKLLRTNESELITAKAMIKISSRLLDVMDNVMETASKIDSEMISPHQRILVESKRTKLENSNDHVIGLSVLSHSSQKSLENASAEFLVNDLPISKENTLVYFTLPPELVLKREHEISGDSHVSIVLLRDWSLLPVPKEVLNKRNYKVLPTPVICVSVSGGPAWNLSAPVQLYFKDEYKRKIEKPVCVYFDPRVEDDKGSWGTEGCEYGGLKDGFFNCRCHHLSAFGILLSQNPYPASDELQLSTAIYVGCAASIIALCLTVLLYLLSKEWRSTVDHSLLFWIALSFLSCLIMVFVSEMRFRWKHSCVLLAFLLHYSVMVTVSWLVVQGFMHRLRFAYKTDIAEVPCFICKAFIVACGFPAVVILIIWFAKDFEYCSDDTNCLKTVMLVSQAALIPTVLLILVAMCFNLCALYSMSCRFKNDFVVGNSTHSDSVLKFRVAVTIYLFFALSWLFGFLALNFHTKELRILFSISITLTSYYITLFFVFHEVSFWELLRKWKGRNAGTGEAVKYIPNTENTETQPINK